ncbi:enoyl-CoA hydratase/isomerase family protein [Halococcus sp. AFM35]|uniref:enoyl-CoA hydratase/isomerase family protein n=1 Tax=Halococcus sp. AFM35 TaxID=3421653 RepID=UPI003EB815C5
MESFSELDLENFSASMDGHVGILRLDRAPVNAHNLDMILELQRAVEAVRFDDEVRVAVLASANEDFFSTGYDIQALQDETGRHIGKASQTSKEVIMKMRTTDTIFIAAVDGHCMGGGLEFALACDFRFVGDDADYNIGIPEVDLGLIPGEAGTQLLPRTIGRSKAMRMMVSGEPIAPEEATDEGLFDELHPPEELEDAALDFAEQLVEKPNRAIGFNKLAVNEGMELPLWDALAHERELQNQLFETPGAEEGIGAFLEDRDPDFVEAELGEDAKPEDER